MSESNQSTAADDGLCIVRFGDLHEPQGSVRRMVAAVPATARAGVAGGANGLERVPMLDAIDDLRRTSFAIEALEVVRAVCERPQYTIERRSYERGIGEAAGQWCMRSHHQARDFVAMFADPGDGSVRFILVVTEAEGLRKAA